MRNTLILTGARMRLALRNRAFMFFSLIMPLAFLFLYLGVFGRSFSGGGPYMLGPVIALTVMGSFWGLSVQIVLFRERGILRRFRLAPVGAGAMLASGILSNYILTLPTLVIELLLARWIFGITQLGNLWGVFLMASLGIFVFAAMGLIVASVTNTMQETQLINNAIWFAFLFLSGATVPLPVLPNWVQTVAVFIPATYLVNGLQQSIVGAVAVWQVLPEMAVLAGGTATAFLISFKLFRWEPEEKVTGTAKLWAVAAAVPFLVFGVWESATGVMRREARRAFDMARSQNILQQAREQMVMLSSGFVQVAGGRLYYESSGQGPAVILIHSGLADRRLWDAQWIELARSYRVIRYDVRGFGRSDAPAARYSPVQDLAALMEKLSVEKAVLVGVSMGGGIALDFAVEYPEKVAALVPVAAGLGGYDYSPALISRVGAIFEAGKKEGASRAVEMWLDDPMLAATKENPAALARLRMLLDDNIDGFLQSDLAESANPSTAQRIERLAMPVLLVVGDRDDPEIIATAKWIEERVKGAKREMVGGAGHLVNLDQPGEFNRILAEFLSSLPK